MLNAYDKGTLYRGRGDFVIRLVIPTSRILSIIIEQGRHKWNKVPKSENHLSNTVENKKEQLYRYLIIAPLFLFCTFCNRFVIGTLVST